MWTKVVGYNEVICFYNPNNNKELNITTHKHCNNIAKFKINPKDTLGVVFVITPTGINGIRPIISLTENGGYLDYDCAVNNPSTYGIDLFVKVRKVNFHNPNIKYLVDYETIGVAPLPPETDKAVKIVKNMLQKGIKLTNFYLPPEKWATTKVPILPLPKEVL